MQHFKSMMFGQQLKC